MGIHFHMGAADEAARQLELTVQSLLSMVAVVEQSIPVTTEDWRGRFGQTFDYESARHVAARTLAQSLHLTAVGIRAKQFEAQATINLGRED
ncbi:MAG: hypothetical protein WKF43_08095 [Acidimicrobiales bacterium]